VLVGGKARCVQGNKIASAKVGGKNHDSLCIFIPDIRVEWHHRFAIDATTGPWQQKIPVPECSHHELFYEIHDNYLARITADKYPGNNDKKTRLR
jgi:hypothetical protein